MKKAVIGVVPLYDDEKESVWMIPGYLDCIEEAGGLPIILPFTTDKDEIEQAFEMCDGLLFTGGHDVSPRFYSGNKELCGKPCEIRDEMEKRLFSLALKADKPSFGICRGIQLFNVLLGGTLYEDIPSQLKSELIHKQKPPYDIPSHEAELIENSPLYDIIKQKTISVNSYHHQGIRKLAPALKIAAKASDGLIEGVYMPDRRFILAVQWHPEFNYKSDGNSMKLIEKFVKAAKGEA